MRACVWRVHTCTLGRYMAPEVFRHEPYNLKVDVYSFAMIVFQVRCRTRAGAATPPAPGGPPTLSPQQLSSRVRAAPRRPGVL